jgi:K+-sensing histidine kinase KdpD
MSTLVSAESVKWALPAEDRGSILLVGTLSLLLVTAIGVLDTASGTELSLSPLYLLAVIIGTWGGGRWLGFGTAIASALVGFFSDLLLSEPYLHLLEHSFTSPWIPVCNAFARLLVLVSAVVAVSRLQALLRDRDAVACELEQALRQIRTLESLLPVCAWCKRIRDEGDNDAWKPIERYIVEHTNTKFTHGMCPECCERVWREEGL